MIPGEAMDKTIAPAGGLPVAAALSFGANREYLHYGRSVPRSGLFRSNLLRPIRRSKTFQIALHRKGYTRL
jgi:hypothetical protein